MSDSKDQKKQETGNPAKDDPHAKGKAFWRAIKDAGAEKKIAARVGILITSAEHSLREKATIGSSVGNSVASVAKSRNREISLVCTSGDTLKAALGTLGAEEKDIGFILVSPHAPERSQTIALLRKNKWLLESTQVSDTEYVVCDLYNTCSGVEGVCDGSCGRHTKPPVRFTINA